ARTGEIGQTLGARLGEFEQMFDAAGRRIAQSTLAAGEELRGHAENASGMFAARAADIAASIDAADQRMASRASEFAQVFANAEDAIAARTRTTAATLDQHADAIAARIDSSITDAEQRLGIGAVELGQKLSELVAS